jgi:hypothetical protein
MMSRLPSLPFAVLILVLTLAVSTAGGPAAQGVTVALTPGTQEVTPGAEFDVDVTVTQAGAQFNGFDAIIGWDPAALTPVSQQEGSLMTDACSNTFHVFRQGASTDTIADVLLCGGVSVTGPGQIYRLRFRASDTPQVTRVRFLPGLYFYDAGRYVVPITSTDATITIGVVGVGPPVVPGKLQLRVAPNPSRGSAVCTIESDRAGPQRLKVFDTRGRLVRSFEDSVTTVGARKVTWDGRDSMGKDAPPGIYLVTLEAAGRSVSGRISLLR